MNKAALLIIPVVGVAGFFIGKSMVAKGPTVAVSALVSPESSPSASPTVSDEVTDGFKTFRFSSFHGQDFGGAGLEFQYPASWNNDGQYFSPQKIKYYDIISADAPVYYDLVSTEIFDTGDLKYQITTDKRHAPDSTVIIDGKTFKKYDLIDYQNDDRVIIFLGPQISIYNDSYYLVFRWEETPLSIDIPGNDPAIFQKMVESLRFR